MSTSEAEAVAEAVAQNVISTMPFVSYEDERGTLIGFLLIKSPEDDRGKALVSRLARSSGLGKDLEYPTTTEDLSALYDEHTQALGDQIYDAVKRELTSPGSLASETEANRRAFTEP